MRKELLAGMLLAAGGLVVLVASTALAGGNGGGGHFRAQLNGYNEVVGSNAAGDSGSVSTTGRGRFEAQLRQNPLRIHYRLRYQNMEDTVTQAHIHFAQRHVGGGVIAFLCGGGGKPACTSPNGDIQGDILQSDIIGPAGQGIEPGAFAEAVAAMRAGATYANVHSTPRFPEGEIRGQIRGRGDDD